MQLAPWCARQIEGLGNDLLAKVPGHRQVNYSHEVGEHARRHDGKSKTKQLAQLTHVAVIAGEWRQILRRFCRMALLVADASSVGVDALSRC